MGEVLLVLFWEVIRSVQLSTLSAVGIGYPLIRSVVCGMDKF